MYYRFLGWAFLATCLFSTGFARAEEVSSLPTFEGSSDLGNPARAGSVEYQALKSRYLVAGGGANMWATNDACHFVWKKVSGDVSLAADIAFVTRAGDPHRKACLMIRQTLDADSAYADVVLHGDGMTSLQYRDGKGALTREIQTRVDDPTRLRLEKRGGVISLSAAENGGTLHPSGASYQLNFTNSFYVGLAVCAHDTEAVRQATFSNVDLTIAPADTNNLRLISALETVTIATKDRHVIYWTTNHIAAPNWSGNSFFFNGGGRIYRLSYPGIVPEIIDTAFATNCNNDHGLSPDGIDLAISDNSQTGKSLIYILPATGGPPRQITANGPSYFHGWSPDGRTLAFCARRKNELDVYAIPAAGGPEQQLTLATGMDDGPGFSPDGQFIYFNSERSGSMQIWRMWPDGSRQQQVTDDDRNNWFPHVSPDGQWLVYLSYEKGVKGHPENQDVLLKLKSTKTGEVQVLAKLFGGQGTLNVPSWSADSKRLAFISYQFVP